MIAKNTTEYKKAQTIANNLVADANINRRNNNSYFDIASETVGRFVFAISKLDAFAAKIAETVDKSMNPYGYQVARISDKQAWILACAAVENNIEY